MFALMVRISQRLARYDRLLGGQEMGWKVVKKWVERWSTNELKGWQKMIWKVVKIGLKGRQEMEWEVVKNWNERWSRSSRVGNSLFSSSLFCSWCSFKKEQRAPFAFIVLYLKSTGSETLFSLFEHKSNLLFMKEWFALFKSGKTENWA